MVERKAVIDLGTNTFNLLIAEASETDFRILHSEKEGVALGMGGIHLGQIAPEAFERGITALCKFKSVCQTYGVNEITAIGTSALRDAMNQAKFVEQAYQQTGIEIKVISGNEEAELIYKGVNWSYPFQHPGMIMDIGGGSTEFVLADESGILWKKSFDIGVARIYQEMQLNDPLSKADVLRIENWLDIQTQGLLEEHPCIELIGASGSFETFYEMIHQKAFDEHFKTLELPIDELKRVLEWMIHSSFEEREKHPYIISIRRMMGPIAAVKTKWVMKRIGVKKCFVTPCSLKEGVIRTGIKNA